MYLDHFGLKEAPFRITPHTDFFFAGANRGATLEALLYAITHDEGIVKVSGEVGSGKTMLCRVLLERLPATVETIYLANPSLSRDEILFAIGDELKLDLDKTRLSRVLRALQDHLIRLFAEGRRVVVLIDEAHAMPDETLEEIRLLSNLESDRHKLLQMVLFGQPELDQHLDTAGMRQLKERITHSFRLEPLVRSDVDSYIDFRMRAAGYRGPKIFNPGAVRLITQVSEGLTRRVNILADKALLAAFASGTHGVTEVEAKRAVRDSDFYKAHRNRQAIWIGTGLAAAVALGWGVSALLVSSRPVQAPGAPSAAVAHEARPLVPATQAATPGVPPGAVTSVPGSGSGSAPASHSPPPAPSAEPRTSVAVSSANPPPRVPAVAERAEPRAVTPGAKPAEVPGAPVPPAQGRLLRERFIATQKWLRRAPGDRFSVQLAIASSSELDPLEDFLLAASEVLSREEFFVYSVKIGGRQHYRVAYGTYASAAEARAAIDALPPMFAAYRPYYRSVERMRSQNRQ
jgi:MSHA biogenesis protein MshM